MMAYLTCISCDLIYISRDHDVAICMGYIFYLPKRQTYVFDILCYIVLLPNPIYALEEKTDTYTFILY